ncbi:hypothetical protein MTYP_00589 [Methylophilaceae bacterium]|nr:hypothetical protein MTYP_00589 [Methylophilaceae bacterium]
MVKKSLIWIYRSALAALWLTIFILATAILLLRYLVLPNIDQYKDQIAEKIGQSTGQKITIGNIQASWNGMNPHLGLRQVALYDAQGRMALTLHEIETSLSWLSIPLLEPKLSELQIQGPVVSARRLADGTLVVAGIEMGGTSRPELANWILRQTRIDILDATVLWQDELRGAPPLTLNNLNLSIENPVWESLLGRHRFGLQATPSAGSSQPIDLRGNLYGKDVSQPETWHGTVYGRMDGTDIAAWRQWVDYPFHIQEGNGAARFWLDFAAGEARKLTTDVLLQNVRARLSKSSAEARLQHLGGRLHWTRLTDGQELGVERLKVAKADGMGLENGTMTIRERSVQGKDIVEGKVSLDEFDLVALNHYASYLPLPKETLEQLAEISPVGSLRQLKLSWKGDGKLPSEYDVRSQFSGLGINAYGQVPGFSHLNGSLTANEKRGSLTINSQQAVLDFKKVMRWPIPAGKLSGQVKWTNNENITDVRVTNLAVNSPHISGLINASYLHSNGKPGVLDLTGRFDRANAKYALFYYPKILGEHTLHWLDTSIHAGDVSDVSLIVKGRMDQFPYTDPKQGLFKVTAKLKDGILDYGTGWPRIEKLNVDMLFQGSRMELNSSSGEILGNQIRKAKAVIPVLDADYPILSVDGETQGSVSDGVRFINNSPVLHVTEGFTETLKTSGNGKLNLQLQIPLHDVDASKVKGAYQIVEGAMSGPSIPDLTRINGTLAFTESGMSGKNITTMVYDGPARLDISTGKNRLVRIAARGSVADSGLKQAFRNNLLDHVSGSADWYGDISIQQQLLDVTIRSSLTGMALDFPPPLGKPAAERMPLRIEKKQQSAGSDTITISLANQISARILRTEKNGRLEVDRGEIGINLLPEIPAESGIAVRGTFEELNVDKWLEVLKSTRSGGAASTSGKLPVQRVNLTVNALDIFERRINNLKLNAKEAADGWQMQIQSREVNGDANWISTGNGKIQARLKSLIAPSKTPDNVDLSKDVTPEEKPLDYPDLDITAENFELGQRKLGSLELLASERSGNWRIEKMKIFNPDSIMTANGEWHNWKRNPNTQMNVRWDINEVGNTLERYGHPQMVKGGNAILSGKLQWPGSPHEFNIENLSGNFSLDARNGQILKIQPGVGRLFSVLTLQNLPRRLTFDFRDVLSSGFTFDKISSNATINQGVLSSNDFLMEGPTAKVEIKGQTDLKKETQHLHVKVTPFISDSVSLAALAGGPAVAAAAFVAQKLLKDPLNKFAAEEYEIVGTWDKPVEVKPDKANEEPVKNIPGQ